MKNKIEEIKEIEKNKKSVFLSLFSFGINVFFWLVNGSLTYILINILYTIQVESYPSDLLGFIKNLTLAVPIDVIIILSVFSITPIISILLVLFSKSLNKPHRLAQIMFGFELPVMATTLARLFFLRTLTPVNILLLSAIVIGIGSYLFYIFCTKIKNKFLGRIQLLSIQSVVVIGIYISLLTFFFIPIVIALLLGNSSFDFFYATDISSFIMSLGIILFTVSLSMAPFAALFLYWRASLRLSSQISEQKQQQTKIIRLIFSICFFIVLGLLAYQSSLVKFYNQIDEYRLQSTFETRSEIAREILKNQNKTKKHLTNSYLSNYRYLTDTQMNLLKSAYEETLKLDSQQADNIQKIFVRLALPFVYQGDFTEDVKKANQDYETIFDEPIQLGESKYVSRTLKSSFMFDSDSLKSSVLDKESNDVHLEKRTVFVKPEENEQFATITIEEEYLNLTSTEQEVYYLFSLPQDSVIIDLKLGPDLDAEKFPLEIANNYSLPEKPTNSASDSSSQLSPEPEIHTGEVAAKGAAQQTYEAQYRKRIDPAIIEQVGPSQYKLRIYPIPITAENSFNPQGAPVRNQKMQFSYVTPINADGSAALPQISEKRNIFSDNKSIIIGQNKIDDYQISVTSRSQAFCGSQSSKFISSENSSELVFIPHSAQPFLPNDIKYNCAKQQFENAEKSLSGYKIAILADSSYSMGVNNWSSYLATQMPLETLLRNNKIDLFFFNDLVSQPISLNQLDSQSLNQPAFGKTNRLQALKEIAHDYDTVIMFTDGSNADQIEQAKIDIEVAQPIYLIFKDNLAPALSDNLLTYLQANGARVVNSGLEAMQNFAVLQATRNVVGQDKFVLIGEAGTWLEVKDNDQADYLQNLNYSLTSPALEKIFIHRLIESQMMAAATDLNQLPILDELNHLAAQNSIVTPYSSLIVLVTDAQKKELQAASLSEDRFMVTHNLGEKELAEPASGGLMGTSAVPEPHEWFLILSGGLLILFLGRQQIAQLIMHRSYE